MDDVTRHYAQCLATRYTWLMGGMEAMVARAESCFQDLAISPRDKTRGSGLAVDLGAGSGAQSIALARAGYRVLALDTSAELLAELAGHAKGLAVSAVQADIRDVARHVPDPVELVVCMGDTLPHLADQGEVAALFRNVAGVLEPGGRFVLTFRDLTRELTGLDRFIHVRGDSDTQFTCFLEYEPGRVWVHDLIHVRAGGPSGEAGTWQLEKSRYPKLRLAPEWAAAELAASGLTVDVCRAAAGLVTCVARRETP